MKELLVPIDFTAGSENALRYALDLADSLKARLSLLHVIEERGMKGVSQKTLLENYIAGDLQKGMTALKKMAAQIQDDIGLSLPIYYDVKKGKTANEIIQYADKIAADLIVMSTWWSDGLERAWEQWKGNMATKVIEKTKRPVLLIPEHTSFSGFEHIVYATNFREREQRIPKELLALSGSGQIDLSVVHVHRSGTFYGPIEFEFLNKLYRMEKGRVNVFFYTIHHERVIDGLNDFINKEQGDVLAILIHDKLTVFDRLLGMFIPKHMSFHSKVPLLILHQEIENQ